MVIIMVKVFSKEETTAVSAMDFDRLEGRVSDENRKARQELSDHRHGKGYQQQIHCCS